MGGVCSLLNNSSRSPKKEMTLGHIGRGSHFVGLNGLFLLAQDAHRNIEDRRVVQRNNTTIRSRLKVNTYTLLGYMAATKVVTYGLNIQTQFICNTLRATARQFVLDTTQFVKCDNHIRISFS